MSAKPEVIITTDGSSLGNPGPGGYAAILEWRDKQKFVTGGFSRTTNNRMEIMAVLFGLAALKKPARVTIRTDSQYVARAITEGWLNKWQKNGWRTAGKKPVKNRDLWEALARELEKHEVQFEWIRGHSGDERNEKCDEMARAEAAADNLPEDTGYQE
ncbi:MAG: ribonuclease HI [Desulfonatronovibrionaceae bacterium]